MKNYSGRDHAVVIGGGIGGMVTARVLCDHFSKVTIVERDPLPKTPQTRRSVPQGNYLHILLSKGFRVLDELFPELLSALESDGAVKIDIGADLEAILPQGRAPKYESDVWIYGCSRPLLEWHIHRQLLTNSKISIIEQSNVLSLQYDREENRVTGISFQQQDSSRELFADIVVDASGRASKARTWLENLGFEKPEETAIAPPLVYNCRLYERPENFQAGWKMLAIYPDDTKSSRGGCIYPVENNRWMVTLSGAGDAPLRKDAEFLEFARSLPEPDIYNVIKDAVPLSPIHSRSKTTNRIYHFEKLSERPECFFTLGDSVCTFNPVYGQGMTSAILAAVTFSDVLSNHPQELTGLADRFQKKLAEVNLQTWQRGSMDDVRWCETSNTNIKLKKEIEERSKFMNQLWALAIQDTQVANSLWHVLHFLKPANELMTLDIQNKLTKFLTQKKPTNIWHAGVKSNDLPPINVESIGALQQNIGQRVSDKELIELAQVWVRGGEIDWQVIYGEKTPQRINIPINENQSARENTYQSREVPAPDKQPYSNKSDSEEFKKSSGYLDRERIFEESNKFSELIHLNNVFVGRPVFWIHGGVGGVYPYFNVAEGLQRPFYGIQSKGHRPASCKGIKAIAAYYIRIMKSVQPEGPYDLGGYSLGGLICYEIVRQLQELDDAVSSLVMLDTLDTVGLKKLKTTHKSRLLISVNWALAATVIQDPQNLTKTLINRDDIDCSLRLPEFRKKLIDLAKAKSKLTEEAFSDKIAQMTNDFQEFEAHRYVIRPLPSPESVKCYYFRNKNGRFFGDLESYFSISDDENHVDHTDYWSLWEKRIHNFEIIDVDAPNHMDLLLVPKVYESIAEFSRGLYSDEGMTATFLTSFKQQLKNKHGVLNYMDLVTSKSNFISRFVPKILMSRKNRS